MAATHPGGESTRSRPIAWLASIALFVSATALQIAIYAFVVSNGAQSKMVWPLGLFLAVLWLLGPAALATIIAVRRFQLIAPEPGQRSTQALVALLLLPLLSAYLGVFVSFNVWGGK